ncbi:MAG: hypothetical protein U1E30_03080 [Rhodoblastus sp.]
MLVPAIDKTRRRFLETLDAADAADSSRSAGRPACRPACPDRWAPDVPRLVALDADFLGFRGALCGGAGHQGGQHRPRRGRDDPR